MSQFTQAAKQFMHSASLVVTDLASTILFLVVLLLTKDLMLAVVLGVGLGIVQLGWMKWRKQKIDAMQWLSIGLVVVSGIATMLTADPRFVMVKPTIIYCIVGAYMLKPGWMTRYLPPIAQQTVADLAWWFGFAWAGLMFFSAALNIVLALLLDVITWSAVMSIWGLASKVVLFVGQYAIMKSVAIRRVKRLMAANAAATSA